MTNIPDGLCQCGCGNTTVCFKYTNAKRNQIKGKYAKFAHGHASRNKLKKYCTIPDCGRIVHSKGLCDTHYLRKIKGKDLNLPIPYLQSKDFTGKKFGKLTVLKISHIDKHYQRYWECICDCGEKKVVRGTSLIRGMTKSCGCLIRETMRKRSGENSSNWKGGKRKLSGYVLMKMKDHPNSGSNGYIAEHRYIMSEKIGRPLEEWELVHHKNGIRDDNRVENLELLTYSNHHGEIICPYCQKTFQLK